MSYIQQINTLRTQYSQLHKDYLLDSWKQINQNVIIDFYKELCSNIPETKYIQLHTLFNKSFTLNDNKKNIIYRLTYNNKNKDTVLNCINDAWVKLETLYKPIDTKYLPRLFELYKKIQELDHNNTKLEQIIKIYENIIENHNELSDIKQHVLSIDDDIIRENLIDLYNSTENILKYNKMLC